MIIMCYVKVLMNALKSLKCDGEEEVLICRIHNIYRVVHIAEKRTTRGRACFQTRTILGGKGVDWKSHNRK